MSTLPYLTWIFQPLVFGGWGLFSFPDLYDVANILL